MKGDKGEKREKAGEEKDRSEPTSPSTETTEKKEKLDQQPSDLKKGERYNATLFLHIFYIIYSCIVKNEKRLDQSCLWTFTKTAPKVDGTTEFKPSFLCFNVGNK